MQGDKLAYSANRSIRLAVVVTLFSIILAKPAYAYIDPGTVSFAVQAIVAALAAGLFAMKLWWYKIINFFKPSKSSASGGEENE